MNRAEARRVQRAEKKVDTQVSAPHPSGRDRKTRRQDFFANAPRPLRLAKRRGR